jgi:hypothetical protein
VLQVGKSDVGENKQIALILDIPEMVDALNVVKSISNARLAYQWAVAFRWCVVKDLFEITPKPAGDVHESAMIHNARRYIRNVFHVFPFLLSLHFQHSAETWLLKSNGSALTFHECEAAIAVTLSSYLLLGTKALNVLPQPHSKTTDTTGSFIVIGLVRESGFVAVIIG